MTIKTALLSLISAAALSASPIYSTTATLTGVNGASVDGAYTSPYYMHLGTGADLAVFCDDFADHSVLGETYNANVFSGLDLSGAYFDPALYQSIFFLVGKALDAPADQVDIQIALWQLTDPTHVGTQASALWLARAAAESNTVNMGHFIVIDDAAYSGNSFVAVPRRQELIARIEEAPEPTTWFMCAAGIVMFVGGKRRARR